MDVDAILGYIIAAVASMGGAGAVIAAAGKWLTKFHLDTIIKKTDINLTEKFDNLKKHIGNKNHISNARYNLEIKICKSLSGKILAMAHNSAGLFPGESSLADVFVSADKKKRKKFDKENYNRAVKSYNEAEAALFESAPFITRDMFDALSGLKELCGKKIALFYFYGAEPNASGGSSSENANETAEINAKVKAAVEMLRARVAKLDTADGE